MISGIFRLFKPSCLNDIYCVHHRCLSISLPLLDSTSSATTVLPPNSTIIPTFVNNRNPRNLEKLRISEKVAGWDLEVPDRSFWNKLLIEITGRHITAKVLHVYGQVPVSASTNEWCIKKYLYSTRDAVAAKAVGQVLAHRCLQLGITEVACFLSDEERRKEKISLILNSIQEGGVTLEEPSQVELAQPLNHFALPEKSWEVFEEDEIEKVEKVMKKSKSKK